MISLIIPVYNEVENLTPLYNRLVSVVEKIGKESFEFIFVDDCSTDGSKAVLQEIARKDKRIEIIRFSRNCGSHAAVSAGLQFCSGDAAVTIAADLQDPPEIIPRLIAKWKKGFRVVWGICKHRKGERIMTLSFSRLFYFLMNHLTDIRQAPTGAGVFLADKTVIGAFKQASEKNASVYMLIAWLGFSQTSIEYTKEERHSGKSKWNVSKKLKIFFDSLISFSYVPLRLMSLIGAIIAFIGLIYGIEIFIAALFQKIAVAGWTSLMIVMLITGGLQMLMMGMLGEYLWRTYDETRGRPRYVIEKNTILDDFSDYNKD